MIDKKLLEDEKAFHIEKEHVVRNYPINVIEYISKNRDFQNPDRKTVMLALMEDYEVLRILGDELAIKFLVDKKLSNLLSGRNESILAHGFKSSTEENTVELFERLLDYSKETFKNLDKCREYAKFPKFRDM